MYMRRKTIFLKKHTEVLLRLSADRLSIARFMCFWWICVWTPLGWPTFTWTVPKSWRRLRRLIKGLIANCNIHSSSAEPVSLGKRGVCHPVRSERITINERLRMDATAVVGSVLLEGPRGVSRSLYCVSTSHLRRECCWKTHCANSLI